MGEAMNQLRLSAESSLGKILDKSQVGRLKQIQLQLDPAGAFVVLRDDMIEKLNMTEEQVEMLKSIRDGQRQKQGEVRKSGRQAFQAAMEKINPEFAKNMGNRGNRGNRGNGGNGGNGGNAGNGNQGNRPQFDPEEFRKLMDSPEVKAERDKQREQEKAVDDESYAIVTKNLYPRQRATLKKMVGAPFDRSVMGMGGPFGGRGGPGGPGAAATKKGAANGKAAVAKSGSDDDDEGSAAPAAAKAPAPAKAKPSATSARKNSLRELRGRDDDE